MLAAAGAMIARSPDRLGGEPCRAQDDEDGRQHTLRTPVEAAGAGLHTGVRCLVTLYPAPPDHGRRIMARRSGRDAAPMTWVNRVPSIMSTSLALGGGESVRTVEHLMASLAALGVDNVLVEIDGPEVPILDGSGRPWCRRVAAAGLTPQGAVRRLIRVRKPVQVCRDNGFLRVEPADKTTVDLTFDLVPGRRVRRWSGAIDRAGFLSHLQGARSFGCLEWRQLIGRGRTPRRPVVPGQLVVPHTADPALPMTDHAELERELDAARRAVEQPQPVLRGAGPGRAILLLGGLVLPYPRGPDEPLRHVVLDLVGDLALAGAPVIGRIIAHNPSHEKTFMLVAALMRDTTAWEMLTDGDATGPR